MMKKRPLPFFYFNKDFPNKLGICINNNHVYKETIHRHDYYEFELMIRGEAMHFINGEKYKVKEGDLLFITPSDFHGFPESTELETITVHFLEEHLRQPFAQILNHINAFTLRDVSEQVQSDFHNILAIYNENTPWTEYKLKNVLEKIVIDFFEKYPEENTIHAQDNDAVGAAIGYVNRNFRSNMTAAQVSEIFFISQSHFCRAFKKRTGKGFNQYLTEKRLEYSKKLLNDGESVIDTCYESGFSSERNFSRRFKLYTGITPHEYAKQHKLS